MSSNCIHGEVRSVTFNKAGIVAIGCNIHDWMRSYVVITEADRYTVTHDAGTVTFKDLVSGDYEIKVWYPGLGRTIDSGLKENEGLSVLLLSVDRFRKINSALGHDIGDDLIKMVALRLVNTLKHSDTIARLSSDTFAVVLPKISLNDSKTVASRILEQFETTFIIDGYNVDVNLYIGISNFPEHGKTARTLLRHADQSIHEARKSSLRYAIYNLSAERSGNADLGMMGDLRKAIKNDELEVYYQPQVSLETGKIISAEALVRWPRDNGFVYPDEFIPLAESTGEIQKVTHWMLEHAFSDISLLSGYWSGKLSSGKQQVSRHSTKQPMQRTSHPGNDSSETEKKFDQAVTLLRHRQNYESIKAFRDVLKLAPGMPEAYLNLGFAHYEMKRYTLAVNAFETAIDLRPMQVNAYRGLAVSFEALCDIPAAMGAMQTFIHLTKPDDPYLNRAKAALWEWNTIKKNSKAKQDRISCQRKLTNAGASSEHALSGQ